MNGYLRLEHFVVDERGMEKTVDYPWRHSDMIFVRDDRNEDEEGIYGRVWDTLRVQDCALKFGLVVGERGTGLP